MENKILQALLEQRKEKKLKNLCWWTQISFAYNSNRIEGSQLSEEQTQLIYETDHLYFDQNKDAVKIDDIIETANHFRLFDHMLETHDLELSEELIKKYHAILKAGTSQSFDPKYNVGNYKTKPNIIGIVNIIKTSPPEEVSAVLAPGDFGHSAPIDFGQSQSTDLGQRISFSCSAISFLLSQGFHFPPAVISSRSFFPGSFLP